MLKKRTIQIYQYISNYIIANGYSPTIYEIAREFDIGIIGVEYQIGLLRQHGYLTMRGEWNTLYLTSKSA